MMMMMMIKLAFHGADTDTDTDTDFLADFARDPRAKVGVSGVRGSRPAAACGPFSSPTKSATQSANFCPTRALFLARMSVGDARVYT